MLVRLKKVLDDPPEGVGDFWARLHVVFPNPTLDMSDPTEIPSQGYYRNFGVRCIPADLERILEKTVTDGVVDWSEASASMSIQKNSIVSSVGRHRWLLMGRFAAGYEGEYPNGTWLVA